MAEADLTSPPTSKAEKIIAPAKGLAANSIGKAYRGRVVVKDITLTVRRGEVAALMGPNGAGKTTSFYMIMGLIEADRGMISLDGQDITDLPMYQRARLGVGYLPQEQSIFRGLTVEENIKAVVQLTEKDRSKWNDNVDALLDELNIGHIKKSPALALSGGERRRVEIARALASRPSFILLDEPFTGIDPIAIADIPSLFFTSRNAALAFSSQITACEKHLILLTAQQSFFKAKLYLKAPLMKYGPIKMFAVFIWARNTPNQKSRGTSIALPHFQQAGAPSYNTSTWSI